MSHTVTIILKTCLVILTACLLFSTPAFAAAAAATTDTSLWAEGINWMAAQQRAFHLELVSALRLLAAEGSLATAGSLILGSFLYGIFHAAGPGHGKVVLTTYLLTHPHRLSRGIGIAALGALCQGIVAIVLVYGLIYLAGWVPRETSAAVAWSERLSYVFVALIGALLILRLLRKATRRFFQNPDTATAHNHSVDCAEDCGHNHMPSGEQLEQVSGIFSAFGVVLAMGLRPCIGAVLVLVLAKVLSLPWAGAGAVLAMSAGTSITVATLALLAVKLRHKAVSMAEDRNPLWHLAINGVTLAGGGLLLIIGISLLSASFHSRHPLGL